ncbi:hypothetical protein RCL10_11055 [Staphylococcus lloydii]|uniref:hypothetical protein n=1 Tax=Staphylococcus lloydii TaxID=2781774 RepID=UPI0029288F9C|nr:hypothetical protein [Staphylococcus lloydii]MDU9419036.1 hypothetical protein [Staphylococcus lloydii]
MLLLITAIIHLHFSKRIITTHKNTTQKSPMLYQTKRAMLSTTHWETAQLTYKKLNQKIFKLYAALGIPLTIIDLLLIISYRNGSLLIAEALFYIITLCMIYLVLEHKLKSLS